MSDAMLLAIEHARKAVKEDCARLCEQIAADWKANEMYGSANAAIYLADQIRKMGEKS